MVRFASHPANIQDVLRNIDLVDTFCTIMKVFDFEISEYDEFTSNFRTPREWLKGHGGWSPSEGYMVVKVSAPGRMPLYVDPEKSDVARYVGISVGDRHR